MRLDLMAERGHFAVRKDARVVRTGHVPLKALEAQAVYDGETVYRIDARYNPNELVVSGDDILYEGESVLWSGYDPRGREWYKGKLVEE